ncbi:MAG: hypothetical protein V1859_00365 [archaeon]
MHQIVSINALDTGSILRVIADNESLDAVVVQLQDIFPKRLVARKKSGDILILSESFSISKEEGEKVYRCKIEHIINNPCQINSTSDFSGSAFQLYNMILQEFGI